MESPKKSTSIIDPDSNIAWKVKVEGVLTYYEATQIFGIPNQSGWRIPTLHELKTLIANSEFRNKLGNFRGCFCTSTESDPTHFWVVDFKDGYPYTDTRSKDIAVTVQLVRNYLGG